MTDRDTFAAAALTGLLAQGDDADFPENTYWAAAYRMADAMLRERGTAVSDNCVTGNQREMKCPVTEPLPKTKRAEVSFTLTDEERDAIHQAAIRVEALCQIGSQQSAATLRKLLERLA